MISRENCEWYFLAIIVFMCLFIGVTLGINIATSDIGLTTEEIANAKKECLSEVCRPYIVYLPLAEESINVH